LREGRLFCDLPPDVVKSLDAITSAATYPKGAVLFVEGQPARGVFVICNGRVKVSSSSAGGKVMIVRVVEAGEVVGLPGTISGRPYGATAEVMEPAQVTFIKRDAFLQFLRQHGEAAVKVAQLLTDIYEAAHQEVRTLGLSRSASEKLAKFILDWSTGHAQGQDRLQLALTQEEIAEMIGVSRETVTRVLTEFKKKKVLALKGATLTILDRTALEQLAGN
jgi:CRP/FNR family cyclic AMP-dependent transcriptional regulator